MIMHMEHITPVVKLNLNFNVKSSLCDYSDSYILVSGTMTVPNTRTTANPDNKNNIIIKNCASFTDCISEIYNKQIDTCKDTDTVLQIYTLIE